VHLYSYDKGDAVAALLVDRKRQEIILIEQYRYPAHDYIMELTAGALESGEDPQEGIKREIIEETGLRPISFNYCGLFYVAPGVFTERVHVFICEVTPASAPDREAHSADEQEDICIVRIPIAQISSFLQRPMDDLKTSYAILQFLMHYKNETNQREG